MKRAVIQKLKTWYSVVISRRSLLSLEIVPAAAAILEAASRTISCTRATLTDQCRLFNSSCNIWSCFKNHQLFTDNLNRSMEIIQQQLQYWKLPIELYFLLWRRRLPALLVLSSNVASSWWRSWRRWCFPPFSPIGGRSWGRCWCLPPFSPLGGGGAGAADAYLHFLLYVEDVLESLLLTSIFSSMWRRSWCRWCLPPFSPQGGGVAGLRRWWLGRPRRSWRTWWRGSGTQYDYSASTRYYKKILVLCSIAFIRG